MSSKIPEPEGGPDVFLSYNSVDADVVRDVCRLLEARGLTTFLDRTDLVAGLPWPAKLEEGLARAGTVAVFLGASGLGGWQRKEMYFALDRQVAEQKAGRDFPVIPVLLPGAESKAGFLFLNTWVDLRNDPLAPKALDALARAVRGEGPAQAPDPPAVCPYRGLRAFEMEDEPFFCGREVFSERLLKAVLEKPFVAVVGPSGSGKSSLVRAGLLPRLYRQRSPEEVWEAVILRPRRRPFYELASGLLRLAEGDLPFDVLDERATHLGNRLLAGDARLEDMVDHFLDGSNGTDRLLLVVDQLEELFTLSLEEQIRPWVDTLIKATGESLTVVITLRSDFYGQAQNTSRALSDALERGLINLGPMTEEELRRTIEDPAHRVGMSLQEGLAARILADIAAEPGRLPLLEFALTELFRQAQGGEMTHGAYEAFGGVEGAVRRRAKQEFSRLTSEERAAAQRLFVTHLVRVAPPEEGAEDTRRPAHLADLDDLSLRVVEKLSRERARLLVTSRDETTGEEIVEIAHEALIRQWDDLRQWVDDDREFLLWRRRLNARLLEWKAADQSRSVLLTGPPLTEAERWLSERKEDLTLEQREFIEASTSEHERTIQAREQRRQRVVRTAIGLAIVFLMLAGAAFWAWQQARAQERRVWAASVVTNAQSAAKSDPLIAALLLKELAAQMERDRLPSGTLSVAKSISAQLIPRAVLAGHGDMVLSAQFSPDGERIVTASDDGTARVWRSDGSGDAVVLEGHESGVKSAEFSPDGERIVTASDDGTARVWRSDGTGDAVVLEGHEFGVNSAQFSPDGERIVTASFLDGTARVWQVGWESFQEYLQGATSACLSPGQRAQYLAETPEEANDRYRECEARYGRQPR